MGVLDQNEQVMLPMNDDKHHMEMYDPFLVNLNDHRVSSNNKILLYEELIYVRNVKHLY